MTSIPTFKARVDLHLHAWLSVCNRILRFTSDVTPANLGSQYGSKPFRFTYLCTSIDGTISKISFNYKNAFQWDAFRPLVGHIPACTAQGVCISECTGQECVYPSMCWGGSVCPGGHVCPVGCLLREGVSAQGGGMYKLFKPRKHGNPSI